MRVAGLLAFGACAATFVGTTCIADGVLDPHGPVSAAERLILLNSTVIMLVVVVPVVLLTLGFAWWYRSSNPRAEYRPGWSYSGQIELVVWAIPAMVVILLAGVAWIGAHDLDPAVKLKGTAPALRVEVVSLDWKWLFIYPDQGVATVNDLVIPSGAPVEFILTSATVMNAFFVPQLGSQIYTMPGMTTHLNLMADRVGDYPGLSSHFSGDGFSDMRFTVHAVVQADFDQWVAKARQQKSELNAASYAELSRPTSKAAVQTYGRVDSKQFEHVLQLAAPQGAAPQGD
jgi:cytochrome o ubiquinol oxidase subunit II